MGFIYGLIDLISSSGKCEALVDNYIDLLEESRRLSVWQRDHGNNREDLTDVFNGGDQGQIVGYFPVIHFIVLYVRGELNTNQLLMTLHVMCDKFDQSHDFAVAVLYYINNNISSDSISIVADAAADDSKMVALYKQHGLIPVLFAQYIRVEEGDNIIDCMVDTAHMITTIGEMENENEEDIGN